MMQSMTGYAERISNLKSLKAKISIRTLNHRFFDWYYKGNNIGWIEDRLRMLCQKKIHRGRVEVSVELNFLNSSSYELKINEKMLLSLLTKLERISRKLKKKIEFSIDNLFVIPQMIDIKRKDFSREEIAFLERSFEETLDELIRKRMEEGKEICKAIQKHLQRMKKMLNRVERLAYKQPLLLKEKLIKRVSDLSHEGSYSQEKLLEEIISLAQKCDLSEEVARLRIHLKHVDELLCGEGQEPVGKRLDFLMQELYREANTINSKAQDVKIIKEILSFKGEVENIRQQIQNLE